MNSLVRYGSLGGMIASAIVLLCCCSGSFSTRDMVGALASDLVPEEAKIQAICASLEADPYDSELLPRVARSLDPKSTDQAARTIAGEMTANARALLGAVSRESKACKASEIVVSQIRGEVSRPDECIKAIDATFDAVESGANDVPVSTRSLVGALKDAHFAKGKDVVDNLLRATRLVDLSPAVVVASLHLAAGAEQIADDVASSISIAKGLVRVGLQQVAAELVAWTFDGLLDKLEATRMVNPASVARTSCRLHQGAVPRGAVATRVLNRAILRFHQSGWTAETYPMQSICARFQVKEKDRCQQMKAAIVAQDDVEADRSRPLPPTLTTQPDWVANAATVGDNTQKAIQSAAELCTVLRRLSPADAGAEAVGRKTDIPCTMDFLSRVASVIVVYGLDAQRDRAALEEHLKEIDSTLRGVDGRVRALEDRVATLKEQLAAANKSLDEKVSDETRLSRENNNLLIQWFQCEHERARVRAKRVQFVAKGLELCSGLNRANNVELCNVYDIEIPSLEAPDSWGRIEASLALLCGLPPMRLFEGVTSDGGTASVLAERLCDVTGKELQVDLNSASAFEVCRADVREVAKVGIRARFNSLVNAIEPKTVTVIGHTDQQLLGPDCTTRFPSGNDELSEARAREIMRELMKGLKVGSGAVGAQSGVTFLQPVGKGALRPLQDCNAVADVTRRDTCHARNRRVSFEFGAPANATFQARSCTTISKGSAPR